MDGAFDAVSKLKNFKSFKLKLILFCIGLLFLSIFLVVASFFFDTESSTGTIGNGEYDKYEKGRGVCGLIVPLKASYSINSLFGYRLSNAERKGIAASQFHSGIDLGVSSGTNVYAAFSGTVNTGDDRRTVNKKGIYVMIKNESGEVVKYFHLSKSLVTSGQKVNQGDLVAKSGNTGASSGAHLHFEFVGSSGKAVSLNNMFGYRDLANCVTNVGTKSQTEREKCNKSHIPKMSELEKTQFKNACAGVLTTIDDVPGASEETEGTTTEQTETENILGPD